MYTIVKATIGRVEFVMLQLSLFGRMPCEKEELPVGTDPTGIDAPGYILLSISTIVVFYHKLIATLYSLTFSTYNVLNFHGCTMHKWLPYLWNLIRSFEFRSVFEKKVGI